MNGITLLILTTKQISMDPQSASYLAQCYDLLPPFIRAVERKGGTIYLNDVTGDINATHPLDRYKELRFGAQKSEVSSSTNRLDISHAPRDESNSDDNSNRNDEDISSEHEHHDTSENIISSQETANSRFAVSAKSDVNNLQRLMEYHCQWKERNAFGQMSMYGLKLRYNLSDGTTSIRFDGVADSDWTFTALKGPYGAIEPHDLYVGAKVEVFGRHLTISSANSAAVKWIDQEAKRLNNLQNKFRKRIESVGQKPVILPSKPGVVRHVEREDKKAGQTNLRKLMNEISKLGEQLAQLGLSEYALS